MNLLTVLLGTSVQNPTKGTDTARWQTVSFESMKHTLYDVHSFQRNLRDFWGKLETEIFVDSLYGIKNCKR